MTNNIDDDDWDKQMRQDALDGKFDKLIKEVREEVEARKKKITRQFECKQA